VPVGHIIASAKLRTIIAKKEQGAVPYSKENMLKENTLRRKYAQKKKRAGRDALLKNCVDPISPKTWI
jgi:hypothetical protein